MSSAIRRFFLLACMLGVSACQVELFDGLNQRDANTMLSILLSAGIDAQKVEGDNDTYTLTVEERQFAEAVQLLDARGYPREQFTSIGDIFKKEGLISSPLEERVRFVFGLEQSLSRTISEIDGVVNARVHVVLPNDVALDDNPMPSSAAVAIHHDADTAIGELLPQIKQLVTNSIEGLTYDKVSVVLFPVAVSDLMPPTPDMVEVAGYQVHRSSAKDLETAGLALLGALGLSLIGNAVLAFLMLRRRDDVAALADAQQPAE